MVKKEETVGHVSVCVGYVLADSRPTCVGGIIKFRITHTHTEMYPGFQKWGSFGPLLSELGGPSEILGV